MSKAWYTLMVKSNHELKAKEEIEFKLMEEDDTVDIEEVFVPIKEFVSMTNGKKRIVQERTYKGYIFIHADMTDDLYVKLKNCARVQNIMANAGVAIRIPTRDIMKMKDDVKLSKESPKQSSEFSEDDLIRITAGPFEGFEGRVTDIIDKRNELQVEITIFGKNTPVKIGSVDVEKII